MIKIPLHEIIQIGNQFTRWTVIGYPFQQTRYIDGADEWLVPCRCQCGFAHPVRVAMLFNGHSKSCGCLKGERKVLHGEAGRARTHLYRVWYSMKQRCYNLNHTGFKDYGARGIQVSLAWKESFISFRDYTLFNETC